MDKKSLTQSDSTVDESDGDLSGLVDVTLNRNARFREIVARARDVFDRLFNPNVANIENYNVQVEIPMVDISSVPSLLPETPITKTPTVPKYDNTIIYHNESNLSDNENSEDESDSEPRNTTDTPIRPVTSRQPRIKDITLSNDNHYSDNNMEDIRYRAHKEYFWPFQNLHSTILSILVIFVLILLATFDNVLLTRLSKQINIYSIAIMSMFYLPILSLSLGVLYIIYGCVHGRRTYDKYFTFIFNHPFVFVELGVLGVLDSISEIMVFIPLIYLESPLVVLLSLINLPVNMLFSRLITARHYYGQHLFACGFVLLGLTCSLVPKLLNKTKELVSVDNIHSEQDIEIMTVYILIVIVSKIPLCISYVIKEHRLKQLKNKLSILFIGSYITFIQAILNPIFILTVMINFNIHPQRHHDNSIVYQPQESEQNITNIYDNFTLNISFYNTSSLSSSYKPISPINTGVRFEDIDIFVRAAYDCIFVNNINYQPYYFNQSALEDLSHINNDILYMMDNYHIVPDCSNLKNLFSIYSVLNILFNITELYTIQLLSANINILVLFLKISLNEMLLSIRDFAGVATKAFDPMDIVSLLIISLSVCLYLSRPERVRRSDLDGSRLSIHTDMHNIL